jgi:uncharacterized RDD family membrane protein YckC
MPTPTLCLECNAQLTPSDTGGVCAKCMLKLGLASQLANGSLPATAQGLRPDGAMEEPFDFGGYRILRLLGKGGMGAVYEAEQIDGGRRVALKVLGQSLDTPEMRQRFLREGQLAASVRHENVVAVLTADEIESIPVISMELLHDGTLKDWVSRRGPLPPEEAVDAALQIIAGLEAAHASGVLHRDVKPANCFSTDGGVVKVGDFGLSISTLVKAEHSLTQSGTVLGTPAYAAPEQLRGEDVDARADIYAVGSTLYFLLTGKPAFEEENLVSLIASVLEKDPVNVGQLRRGIPKGLSAIVMRCLAKNRAQRFRDYASLRAALRPYASTAPTPATLGLRFAAGFIDILGTMLPALIGLTLWSDAPETHWISDPSLATIAAALLAILWGIAWFAVPEGLWGRSFGKALCGLRVVRANGHPIGIGTASARATIFSVNNILTPVLTAMIYSAERYRESVEQGEFLPTDWLWIVLFIPLFFTMRRRNGYAAVHDLCTGTRVVEETSLTASAAKSEPIIPPNTLPTAERIGPYTVIERRGCIAEAFDPILRRRVWIHLVEEGTPAVGQRRRDIVRPTRLRWLQGRRSASENWDAYDRPDGASLAEKRDGREPWETARIWLSDLADELHASLRDGTVPEALSKAHVWITASGRAVLLDFPSPGCATESAHPMVNVEQVQAFLHDAAEAAISPLMPVHARTFLTGLHERRFEAPPIVAGNLRALVNRPATTEPRRRAMSAFFVPLVLAAVLVLFGAILFQARREFDQNWTRENPGVESPRLALEVMTDLTDEGDEHRPALTRYLARNYGMRIVGDPFWNGKETEALNSLGLLIREAVEYYIVADLPRIAREPIPGSAEIEKNARLETLLQRQAFRRNPWVWILSYTVLASAAVCVIGIFTALFFRTSLMLRLFGFAVVRHDGLPAERWRITGRAILAAAPVFLASVFLMRMDRWSWDPERSFPVLGTGLLVTVSLFWLAGLAATRGPAEKLTGSWIVPR